MSSVRFGVTVTVHLTPHFLLGLWVWPARFCSDRPPEGGLHSDQKRRVTQPSPEKKFPRRHGRTPPHDAEGRERRRARDEPRSRGQLGVRWKSIECTLTITRFREGRKDSHVIRLRRQRLRRQDTNCDYGDRIRIASFAARLARRPGCRLDRDLARPRRNSPRPKAGLRPPPRRSRNWHRPPAKAPKDRRNARHAREERRHYRVPQDAPRRSQEPKLGLSRQSAPPPSALPLTPRKPPRPRPS